VEVETFGSLTVLKSGLAEKTPGIIGVDTNWGI
jgi:hypothetical protein